jgi:hypothetical protein
VLPRPFNFAARHWHLSPYAENPFAALQIERIPIGQARPITLFTAPQERALLEACDDWQFPLFLTLVLTGLRPGGRTAPGVTGAQRSAGSSTSRATPSWGWSAGGSRGVSDPYSTSHGSTRTWNGLNSDGMG